jgi:phosphate transport system permease protein
VIDDASSTTPADAGGPSVAFTGHARRRATSRGVRVAERVAGTLISIGGVGTIIAVTTICVFLVWVVVPLFGSGELVPAGGSSIPGAAPAPLRLEVDEFRVLAWTVDREGSLEVRRLDDGTVVQRADLFPGVATAWAFGIGDGRVAFGFPDGSTRAGVIGFVSGLMPASQAPASLGAAPGSVLTIEGGVAVRLPDGEIRRQAVHVAMAEPVASTGGSPVALLDQSLAGSREILCVLRMDGTLSLEEVTRTTNLLTEEDTVEVTRASLPFRARPDAGDPRFLRISERGDLVYVAWADGVVQRFDCRDLAKPVLAEVTDLVPDPSASLTCLEFMNGRSTLIAGDSAGGVRGAFAIKPDQAPSPDGIVLQVAHEFAPHRAAVTAAAPSTRTRLFATADDGGGIRVSQMTTAGVISESRLPGSAAARLVRVAPKNDAVVVLTDAGLAAFALHAHHAEASLGSMLLPVWYEGEPEPKHVWQSTGATDDFEPKLGLVPLIFGTLKATLYSLLFAVPLALLAALYTSEFLHPSIRSKVKPAIEMMASLPSVVLGFLAALVIAPFVDDVVPAVLLAFVLVPIGFVVGAFLWQFLPHGLTRRFAGWQRLLVIALLFPAGVLVAWLLAPVFERVFFHGDVKRWLDGQIGGSVGGWTLVLIPPCGVLVAWSFVRYVNPRLIGASVDWGHGRSAVADALRFVAGAGATMVLAVAFGGLLDAAGVDVRTSFFGTYSQRNALIVGFVMGFAVIPIIYTLAEDALASVPASLRSASLGCGATRWQTATRVVLPTALSGIFSAVMIGLGRAVGETMVVLMAGGNTPILEWNMFSGFRTLSGNIAFELPEAVQGSTHYRMLFLAGLTLFLITFVLNTAAELVRLRFRKRAFEL